MTDPEWASRAQKMITRMNIAYSGPTGTWAQRWIPGVCKHAVVRCTHGDEIIGRRWRRRVCMVCGRSLKGPLPEVCYFTDEPHSTHDWPPAEVETPA